MSPAQRPSSPDPRDAVIRNLLLGAEPPGVHEVSAVDAEARRALEGYLRRAQRFRATLPLTAGRDGPERAMQLKRRQLERTLVALFDEPDIGRRAADYAARARLFYEWEGYADAPLDEAVFAEAFLGTQPDTPLAPYLRLFAGHRRLCALGAVEGLDPTSAAGRRVADDARDRLRRARESGHPLIRLAADRLLEHPTCFGDDATRGAGFSRP